MDKLMYEKLNMKILKEKKSVFVSTKDALRDVTPIEWDEHVIDGKKEVTLIGKNN